MPSTTTSSTRGERDLAIAVDGSYVETTSAAAARALAKHYESQGEGIAYAVQARVVDGKTMYRIRPRSTPSSTPTSPISPSSGHLPFARTSDQPPAPTSSTAPTIALPDASPSSQSLSSPPPIPQPPPPLPSSTSNAFLQPTSMLRRAGSTPSLSTSSVGSASSSSLVRSKSVHTTTGGSSGTQGDVLGRLLGWTEVKNETGGEVRKEGTAQLGLPGMFRGEGGDVGERDERHEEGERDSSDLPDDLVEALSSSQVVPARRAPPLLRTNSSPFGAGVRIPSSASHHDLSPSTHATIDSLLASSTSDELDDPRRPMREVASSDSIRTARADDPQPPSRPRYQDPTIFDVFQSLDNAAPLHFTPSPPASPNSNNDQHGRLPSSSSVSSSLSDLLRTTTTAQQITVSSAPGDDPRFVIWGLKDGPPGSTYNNGAGDRRTSLAGEMDVGTPNSGGGSPATTSSKRWSLKDRRSHVGGEGSSPATSVRDSIGSNHAQRYESTQQQRVLMAATIERWVAELTSKIEVDLLSGFFLTFRTFVKPVDLLRLLITRFDWALEETTSPEDEAGRRIVRVRTFVVVRHWLLNHFMDDWFGDRELRKVLTDWLNMMARKDRVRESPKDQRLIKGLKKLVRRLKEMYAVLGPVDTVEAARAMAETTATGTTTATTGGLPVSDEDVDLELDSRGGNVLHHAPLSPRSTTTNGHLSLFGSTTTSSPPPPSSSNKPSFSSSHYSSSNDFNLSRTPQLVPDSTTANFPLPDAQNAVARSFTAALGTFGRFKRMLGNRTGGGGGGTSGSGGGGGVGAGGGAGDGEVEFEQSETGDLLWVKGGLDRYLEYFDIRREEDEDGEEEEGGTPGLVESTMMTPSTVESAREAYTIEEEDEEDGVVVEADGTGLGIVGGVKHEADFDTTTAKLTTLPPSVTPTIPIFETSLYDSSPSYYQPHQHRRPISTSSRIELDDVDLSDEDDDVVEVKRTLKRLPAASNLKNLAFVGDHHPRPSSLDSDASSYGHPIVVQHPSYGGQERESVLFVDDEEGWHPQGGVAIVENFILEGIDDSDEDEPGDVEAALRRLEGLVDDGKEEERRKKVEIQMAKSEEWGRKRSLATSEPLSEGELARLRDSMATTTRTSESGSGSVEALSYSSEESRERERMEQSERREVELEPQAPTVIPSTAASTNDNNDSTLTKSSSSAYKFPPRSLSRRTGGTNGPSRKPSITKIFNVASSSSSPPPPPTSPPSLPRPVSTRPTPTPSSTAPSPPTHKSFILQHRTELLARQFCLIERDMLRVLGWQELVSGAWKERKGEGDVLDWESYLKDRRREEMLRRESGEKDEGGMGGKGKGAVQAVIARFNLTANWVCSEIVLTANPDERIMLIAKFIRLAFKCYCQSNFQTLTQIIHGLQLPAVERLKKTWARVPSWEMRKFRNMQTFVSHPKNFKFLRDVTNALIAEYGPPGQRTSHHDFRASTAKSVKGAPVPTGCIPFLGLFLRDLTLNEELPTFLDPTSTNTPAVISPSGSLKVVTNPTAFSSLTPLPSNLPLQPLINVHKFRIQATIVQRVLAFMEFAEGYPYEPEPTLYKKVLCIRSLDQRTLSEISLRLEP